MRDLHKTSKGGDVDGCSRGGGLAAEPNPEPIRHGEPSQEAQRVVPPASPHCLRLLRCPSLSSILSHQGFVHHSDHVIDILEISVVMGGFRAAEGD